VLAQHRSTTNPNDNQKKSCCFFLERIYHLTINNIFQFFSIDLCIISVFSTTFSFHSFSTPQCIRVPSLGSGSSGHTGGTSPGQTRKKPKDLSTRERENRGCGEGGGLYVVYIRDRSGVGREVTLKFSVSPSVESPCHGVRDPPSLWIFLVSEKVVCSKDT
jgi:hypothetical protein